MTIEEALKIYILAQSGITSLIGARYYPVELPQECKMPAVVYRKISAPRFHAFSADVGVYPRIEFTIYGDTYTSASAVSEQLRAALQNYLNTTMGGAGGLAVTACLLENEDDDYETDSKGNIKRYVKTADYIIWYEE